MASRATPVLDLWPLSRRKLSVLADHFYGCLALRARVLLALHGPKFRGDKMIRFRSFDDRAQALEAAGLSK